MREVIALDLTPVPPSHVIRAAGIFGFKAEFQAVDCGVECLPKRIIIGE